MREGWYLMSTGELERALAAWRAGRDGEFGVALSTEEALARRDEGNVPDEQDRSLRLVLLVGDEPLERKRLRFEPDYHRAPEWRRDGSRPVNVVPLRTAGSPPREARPWWEMPRVQELEDEWRVSGLVAGMRVPADYRSFVFKTVIALQDAGEAVTPRSVGASISRWLSADDARKVQEALEGHSPD